MAKSIIFLCWSGKLSKQYAKLFLKFLPKILPKVDPFFSDNIPKGKIWFQNILNKLHKCYFLLLFLTKENLNEPWINFECGASCRESNKNNISPILINITNRKLKAPLSFFQSTVLKNDDVLRLLKDINKSLGANKISEDKVFANWHKIREDFDLNIKAIKINYSSPKYHVKPSTAKIDMIKNYNSYNIPQILIGKWHHVWDYKRNVCNVEIKENGEYYATGTPEGAPHNNFKITQAEYLEDEPNKIRLDLFDLHTNRPDRVQILYVKNKNTLRGYIEGQPNNPREYNRIL